MLRDTSRCGHQGPSSAALRDAQRPGTHPSRALGFCADCSPGGDQEHLQKTIEGMYYDTITVIKCNYILIHLYDMHLLALYVKNHAICKGNIWLHEESFCAHAA